MSSFAALRAAVFTIFSLVCLLPATGCFSPQPLRFSLLFEEADGLKTGQPVIYDGNRIGEVGRIDRTAPGSVKVEVEILPEHRDFIYREMLFQIVEDRSTGSIILSLQDRQGDHTLIDDGEVIDARPGLGRRFSARLKELGEAAEKAVQNLSAVAAEMMRSLEQSPEAQELKDSLIEFGRDFAAVTRSRYDQFVREELPKLELKAEAYRKKLENEGRKQEAEIFWKWFTRWTEAVRKPGQQPDEITLEEEPKEATTP